MKPFALIMWLSVAVLSQLTLAFYSLFSRYLTTNSSPAIPPLRLLFIANMIAELALISFLTIPSHLRHVYQRQLGKASPLHVLVTKRRQGCSGRVLCATSTEQEGGIKEPNLQEPPPQADYSCNCSVGVDTQHSNSVTGDLPERGGTLVSMQQYMPEPPEKEGMDVHATVPLWCDGSAPCSAIVAAEAEIAPITQLAEVHHRSHAPGNTSLQSKPPHWAEGEGLHYSVHQSDGAEIGEEGIVGETQGHGGKDGWQQGRRCSREIAAHQSEGVRPELPMRRGLSRRFDALHVRRPGRYRSLTVFTLTVSFLGIYGSSALAPVFVDPSIPQLLMQFSVLGTALVQSVLLRVRPPLYTWPCAGLMVGGAAMAIVPTIGQGSSGSLSGGRAWLGILFSILALLFSIVYLVVIQATRHLELKSELLNHTFFLSGTLLFGTLSLPIDGTDWGQQLRPWTAGDWLLLVAMSTVCYVGSATAIQHCVWQLGAATTAMFFGLRLVFTVALSKPVLGSTVIKTGVQVAGVAITAAAVTAYVGLQGWHAQMQQRSKQRQAQRMHIDIGRDGCRQTEKAMHAP